MVTLCMAVFPSILILPKQKLVKNLLKELHGIREGGCLEQLEGGKGSYETISHSKINHVTPKPKKWRTNRVQAAKIMS